MEYIKHLSLFYQKSNTDKRLNSIHICLYHALFQSWILNRFINPLPLNRVLLLKYSKIGSNHTFYKCMSDLHNYGYIEYSPSKSLFEKSCVCLIDFSINDPEGNEKNSLENLPGEYNSNNTCVSDAQQEYLNDTGSVFYEQLACIRGIRNANLTLSEYLNANNKGTDT